MYSSSGCNSQLPRLEGTGCWSKRRRKKNPLVNPTRAEWKRAISQHTSTTILKIVSRSSATALLLLLFLTTCTSKSQSAQTCPNTFVIGEKCETEGLSCVYPGTKCGTSCTCQNSPGALRWECQVTMACSCICPCGRIIHNSCETLECTKADDLCLPAAKDYCDLACSNDGGRGNDSALQDARTLRDTLAPIQDIVGYKDLRHKDTLQLKDKGSVEVHDQGPGDVNVPPDIKAPPEDCGIDSEPAKDRGDMNTPDTSANYTDVSALD